MIGLGEVLHRNGCHLPEMMLFLYVSVCFSSETYISPKDVAPPVMHTFTTWIALLRKFPRFSWVETPIGFTVVFDTCSKNHSSTHPCQTGLFLVILTMAHIDLHEI